MATRNLLIHRWPHKLNVFLYVEKQWITVGVSEPDGRGINKKYFLKDLKYRHDVSFYCPFFRDWRTNPGRSYAFQDSIFTPLVNVYANTSHIKQPGRHWSSYFNFVSPVSILQVSKHMNFEEMIYFVKKPTLSPELRVETNIEFEAEIPDYASSFSDDRWPQLKLEGKDTVRAGEIAEFHILCTNYPYIPFDYYIEATGGYLPKNRLMAVNNPQAQFRWRALDLVPGDKIKLKAGFRFVSGLAEKIVEVV